MEATTEKALGFDPASGEKKGTSESALIVYAACLVCHRRFVLDYWHKRQSPEKHPDTILEYALRYNVRRVRIEINAYQKALARDRRLTEAQQKGNFIIDEWFTGATKHDPAMGIPVLSRMMSTGMWSVPYMLPQDKEHMETMLSQLIRWPAEPNDVVMALWLAELSMQAYLDDLITHVPLMYGNEDDIPAYLLEQVVEIDLAELDDDDEVQWIE